MNIADYYKKGDTILGIAKILFNQLSEDFEQVKIKEVSDSSSGGTPKRGISDYYNGQIPWLKSGELNDGLITNCNEYITEEGLKNSSAKLFPKGSLLVAMYGATAGKTGFLNFEATTNQAVCALFPKEKLNINYFYWFLRQHRLDFIIQSKGGAQPNISQQVIKNTLIPLPSIEKQLEIVSFLEKTHKSNQLDKDSKFLSEFSQRQIEKYFLIRNSNEFLNKELFSQKHLLTQLKQSILQEAIQGKLTADWRKQNPTTEPASELLKRIKAEKQQLIKEKKVRVGKKQKSNDLGNLKFDLPKHWIYSDLDDITQFITDGTHQTPTYTEKGKIFLSAQNVKPFKFMPDNHKYVSEESFTEMTKGKKAEKNDLLIGRVGSKGETAVIDKDLEFAFYVSLGFVKTFKDYTNSNYLAIVMNSPYGVKYATGNMSSIGTSAGNYNLGRIRSFPIPLPPLEEQKEIVKKVEALMQHCQELEQEIQTSEANAQMLMQAVLKEAFEGEKEIAL